MNSAHKFYKYKKDYRFEFVVDDKLDGSVGVCLRVVGILRCFERND